MCDVATQEMLHSACRNDVMAVMRSCFSILFFIVCLSTGWATNTQASEFEANPLSTWQAVQEFYHYEHRFVSSRDGQRTYRLDLYIPKVKPPTQGYSVVYLLDGNAALTHIQASTLADLHATGKAPVLLALSYDTQDLYDAAARAYDYTPAISVGGVSSKPIVFDRQGGGADEFYELLQTDFRPWLYTKVKTNSQQEMLWGHSYGGLFVLHAFFMHPNSFSHYVAGDPSAWWGEGAAVRAWQAIAADTLRSSSLAVQIGTSTRPRSNAPAQRARPRVRPQFDGRTGLRDIVLNLQAQGLPVSHQNYPLYHHGDMLSVSLSQAFKLLARLD